MERLKIYRSGQEVGTVAVQVEGLYTCFESSCDGCGEELCRLYVVGESGRFLLGVPEPVSGCLRLKRKLSCSQTAAIGRYLYGELSGDTENTEAWQSASPLFFSSAFWQKRMYRMTGALFRQEGQIRVLAVPYTPDKEFPFADLFCMARLQQIQDQMYAVYRFDERDWPIL